MNLEKIKRDLGDYDWMRVAFNEDTIDAIKWLVNRVNELESENKKIKECIKISAIAHGGGKG